MVKINIPKIILLFMKKNDEVIEMYKKVNPSKVTSYEKLIIRRKNLFKSLHLTDEIFNGKNILELGGGTGEKAKHYKSLGADVTIVDANPISCNHAEKLGINTINSYIETFDNYDNYNFICCEGVLHHVKNPIKTLEKIASKVPKKSFFLIA
jgi:2-polyprenyl-3-methyl-5-hydroxy-6-metoxy-1,4-benzoquinol methylase